MLLSIVSTDIWPRIHLLKLTTYRKYLLYRNIIGFYQWTIPYWQWWAWTISWTKDPFKFDEEEGKVDKSDSSKIEETSRCVMFFDFPLPSPDAQSFIFGREFFTFNNNTNFLPFNEKFHPFNFHHHSSLMKKYFYSQLKKLNCSIKNVNLLVSTVKDCFSCFQQFPDSQKTNSWPFSNLIPSSILLYFFYESLVTISLWNPKTKRKKISCVPEDFFWG